MISPNAQKLVSSLIRARMTEATMASPMQFTYVVVGGGIAGVSCAEMLTELSPSSSVLLISASALVKTAVNVERVTKTLESFEVHEESSFEVEQRSKGKLKILQDQVALVRSHQRVVVTRSGKEIKYEKLCLCTGARPRLIFDDSRVLGIRDTDSTLNLVSRLKDARRVLIVGNGGIATELVYELRDVDVVWAVRDDSISSVFFDPVAAKFLGEELDKETAVTKDEEKIVKRARYSIDKTNNTTNDENVTRKATKSISGSALGPDWHDSLRLTPGKGQRKRVHIEYNCEVESITDFESGMKMDSILDEDSNESKWAMAVKMSNGKVIGCDLVVSATGVVPAGKTVIFEEEKLELDPDEAIVVNNNMRTSVEHVFAAGDVCAASNAFDSNLWFQMRLWTQARQMGQFAAQCMLASTKNERQEVDFCFELFTHATRFFGHKVILLGLFNGQNLSKYEVLMRATPGQEFVKVIMLEGRMVGALLIGETDLEETFENVILNQNDLSALGDQLLDPSVDLEDYFD